LLKRSRSSRKNMTGRLSKDKGRRSAEEAAYHLAPHIGSLSQEIPRVCTLNYIHGLTPPHDLDALRESLRENVQFIFRALQRRYTREGALELILDRAGHRLVRHKRPEDAYLGTSSQSDWMKATEEVRPHSLLLARVAVVSVRLDSAPSDCNNSFLIFKKGKVWLFLPEGCTQKECWNALKIHGTFEEYVDTVFGVPLQVIDASRCDLFLTETACARAIRELIGVCPLSALWALWRLAVQGLHGDDWVAQLHSCEDGKMRNAFAELSFVATLLVENFKREERTEERARIRLLLKRLFEEAGPPPAKGEGKQGASAMPDAPEVQAIKHREGSDPSLIIRDATPPQPFNRAHHVHWQPAVGEDDMYAVSPYHPPPPSLSSILHSSREDEHEAPPRYELPRYELGASRSPQFGSSRRPSGGSRHIMESSRPMDFSVRRTPRSSWDEVPKYAPRVEEQDELYYATSPSTSSSTSSSRRSLRLSPRFGESSLSPRLGERDDRAPYSERRERPISYYGASHRASHNPWGEEMV
jgi:hypothetical protein